MKRGRTAVYKGDAYVMVIHCIFQSRGTPARFHLIAQHKIPKLNVTSGNRSCYMHDPRTVVSCAFGTRVEARWATPPHL